MNKIALFLAGITFLSACKSSNSDKLCQKWKTVSFRNFKMQSDLTDMQHYIDTLGAKDPDLHRQLDVDSLKQALKVDLEAMKQEQQLAQDNTLMEFRKNGLAFMTSIEGTDSAMYTLEGNLIKIDEGKLKGYGETMTFEILHLTKDTLSMRFVDYGDTSFVLLVPAK